ncbi:hypothetical protein D3C71_1742930 [compost metagenome]
MLDDVVENDLLKLGGHVCRLHLGVLDFLLDVFFLVGQVFVKLAIALHIGLLFQ